ncbi:MAG: helix-turn-helix transcriptional regulator [Lachnospiraceae bacterium]|nr:helix-turn-helix transcriptional regulator [Lachnospiraceae bacterium]
MTCAYNELYLPLAQRNLGDMYDYAVNSLKLDISEFHKMFLISGMAHQFEICNPHYVAGKNGCEIAREVINTCTGDVVENADGMYLDKSAEYWIGWSLAYYQWYSLRSYSSINESVPIAEIYGMYTALHEADISLFVEIMDEKCSSSGTGATLKRLREYAHLSQSKLAARSGVPLRQIQLFEQGHRDITKTSGQTLLLLSRALGCTMEDLIKCT